MKIGLDATSLCRTITGLESYTLNLCRNTLKHDTLNEYVLFFRKEIHPELLEFKNKAKFVVCPFDCQIFCEQIWLPYAAVKEKVDFMHFPAFPPGLATIKIYIYTIHDAVIWKFVDTLSWKGRCYMRPLTILGSKKAAKIITVSKSSKNDIVYYAGVNPGKVYDIGESISENFRIIGEKDKLENLRRKYNLPRKFILSVGSLEPRKNLVFLLKVYKKFREKNYELEHNLVLVGRKAWGKGTIYEKLRELELSDEVIITGYIPEDDLIGVYNLADIFVFPSLYEGFGLPPLEAMACGTPVIASRISALSEVLGDSALLADPHDINNFVKAIEKLLSDSDLRKKLIRKGLERSASFNWEHVIKNIVKVYQSL